MKSRISFMSSTTTCLSESFVFGKEEEDGDYKISAKIENEVVLWKKTL